MNEYRSNSHKSKENEKKTDIQKTRTKKVISGTAKLNEKTNTFKILDLIFSEDISEVKNSLFQDVVIPSIKKVIYDVGTRGLDMILYGLNGSQQRQSSIPGSKIGYSSFFNSGISYKDTRENVYDTQRTSDYNRIVLQSRGDAEAVLMQLDDILERYKVVRVADLYETVGITGDYTSHNYGWKENIRSARIERVHDGYSIRFPKAMALD